MKFKEVFYMKKVIALVVALISACAVSAMTTEATTTVYSNGDVNGDGTVTSYDAILVHHYLKGYWYAVNNSQLDALDANNDYIIDYADYEYILNMAVGNV